MRDEETPEGPEARVVAGKRGLPPAVWVPMLVVVVLVVTWAFFAHPPFGS